MKKFFFNLETRLEIRGYIVEIWNRFIVSHCIIVVKSKFQTRELTYFIPIALFQLEQRIVGAPEWATCCINSNSNSRITSLTYLFKILLIYYPSCVLQNVNVIQIMKIVTYILQKSILFHNIYNKNYSSVLAPFDWLQSYITILVI